MVDDVELEERMRAGLERRAHDADVDVPVVARATGAVRRRHRGRLVVGFAAASIAAVIVVAALGSTPPSPDDSGSLVVPADDLPDEWRTEYWHDIQVDVPADWAFGIAPLGDFDSLSFCGEIPEVPYVGRPIAQSDACGTFQGGPPVPTQPYVWIDAKLPPGEVDLGDGWVRKTITVAGTSVSVASQELNLRERILGSVREQSLCPPELTAPPSGRFDVTTEGTGTVVKASICAYLRGNDALRLILASEVGADRVQDTFDAVWQAPESETRCKDTNKVVVLSVEATDPWSGDPERVSLHQDLVYDLSCDQVRLGPGTPKVITEEAVESWAGEGTRATVCWGGAGWAHKYFLQGWC